MKGIINVLKPSGMTSHDVVSFIRKTFNMKKVGHTGTLDPNAAGVLPICIGKATRVAEYFNDFNKTYRGQLTLGYSTDTQDKYGVILENSNNIEVTEEEIVNVFDKFKGDIDQIPPMYSAVKRNGIKLYELAREGKTIEREKRRIKIYSLDIIRNYDNKKILFDVECSKGTYVRTLCNDIGEQLGTLGHMSFLIRTKVGNFSIKDAYTLEEIINFKENNTLEDILMPIDTALLQYRNIVLDEEYFQAIKNGLKVKLNNNIQRNKEELFRIYCGETFIGIGTIIELDDHSYLKMQKVLL